MGMSKVIPNVTRRNIIILDNLLATGSLSLFASQSISFVASKGIALKFQLNVLNSDIGETGYLSGKYGLCPPHSPGEVIILLQRFN